MIHIIARSVVDTYIGCESPHDIGRVAASCVFTNGWKRNTDYRTRINTKGCCERVGSGQGHSGNRESWINRCCCFLTSWSADIFHPQRLSTQIYNIRAGQTRTVWYSRCRRGEIQDGMGWDMGHGVYSLFPSSTSTYNTTQQPFFSFKSITAMRNQLGFAPNHHLKIY